MARPTVDLEDEPITEHEVDPADAGDLDLRPQPQTQAVETQAEQGFQPALGIGPGEIDQPARRLRDPGSQLVRPLRSSAPWWRADSSVAKNASSPRHPRIWSRASTSDTSVDEKGSAFQCCTHVQSS